MSRRKRRRNREQHLKKVTYKRNCPNCKFKALLKSISRYSTNKRSLLPLHLTKSPPRLNKLTTKIYQTSKQKLYNIPNLLHKINNSIILGDRERCKVKTEKADSVRRRNFFRAKGKGSTSIRPEHNQRHKRC